MPYFSADGAAPQMYDVLHPRTGVYGMDDVIKYGTYHGSSAELANNIAHRLGLDSFGKLVSSTAGSVGEAQQFDASTSVPEAVIRQTSSNTPTLDGDVSASSLDHSLDQSGYDQAEWEFLRQQQLLAEQRAYNSAEAEKNRQWQERMSNTAYQRAVEDLEKAGLNKWLAISGGNGASASTPSGSSATSSAGDASAPNPVLYREIIKMISSIITSAQKGFSSIFSAALLG